MFLRRKAGGAVMAHYRLTRSDNDRQVTLIPGRTYEITLIAYDSTLNENGPILYASPQRVTMQTDNADTIDELNAVGIFINDAAFIR